MNYRRPPLLNLLEHFLSPSAIATTSVITSFQLCLEKMELDAEDGSAIENAGAPETKLSIGMVDLGDGTHTAIWGTAALPTGVAVKRLKVVIHKSPEVCGGAEYSMSINGQTVTKDLELKFYYPAAKALTQGDTITFSLATLVGRLTQAYQASHFNDENISNYLDGTFEDEAK